MMEIDELNLVSKARVLVITPNRKSKRLEEKCGGHT